VDGEFEMDMSTKINSDPQTNKPRKTQLYMPYTCYIPLTGNVVVAEEGDKFPDEDGSTNLYK
jgi:hypothetical protein